MSALHQYLAHELPRHALAAGVLAGFVTCIAYVHRPRVKALIYSLPVPFTLAYLATVKPVNTTHLTGLALVVGYNWAVYLLARRGGLHLGGAIAVSVGLYVLAGIALKPLAATPLPPVAAGLFLVWLAAANVYRPKAEPGHRGRAAWYVKAPAVFAIGVVMYSMTGLLAGAVTTFPYAGVFTSYEARHSLRTLAGQFTINAVGIGLMIVVIWAVQGVAPWPWGLAAGWAAVVGSLGVIYRVGWGRVG